MYIRNADELIFGQAPRPVSTPTGLVIGGGTVYPEINFTLPPIQICEENRPAIREHYSNMIAEVCRRAVELQTPGLVVEFETLPRMTEEPDWAAELTGIIAETLREYSRSRGLVSSLRLTPNDLRDQERPPRMRDGYFLERMEETFERGIEAGADMVAIESTGGKEVFDEALMTGDLKTIVFAIGVLACRDMEFLWEKIVSISRAKGAIPSGDSACGFANTAMVLAEQNMVPRVLAATIRTATVPRSLLAYRVGAVGPSKDCAYEGPYMKAIEGVPISMEGRSAACAHLSPLGNVSQAACDLWSNESVQNVRLLSANAPVVSMEQLIYDCRLLNQASRRGSEAARLLRDLLVDSDASLDPQAFVLRPDVVIELSTRILTQISPYQQTVSAVRETLALLERAHASGDIALSRREAKWLERLRKQADQLPDDEPRLVSLVDWATIRGRFRPQDYALDPVGQAH